MNRYEPVLIWELTRAAFSIAAWWVLFYQMHCPALWRHIALLIAMPAAYTFWVLMPMNVLGSTVLWALFPILFAVLCGDLRRSLFTAFFYIGMEASIDYTRSSFSALIFGRSVAAYSPEQYLQYNLQYLLVFAAALYYYNIMKRYAAKPPLSAWIVTIIPPFGLWAVLTLFVKIGDPLLLEQGINIYLPGFCFGIFSILCNLGVFYVHIHALSQSDAQTLAMKVSGTPPVWTPEAGLSPQFCAEFNLTDREKQAAEKLILGKSNKEIAESLAVSTKTVEAHLRSLYRKTGAPNRFALFAQIKTHNQRIRVNPEQVCTGSPVVKNP
ncbi:response regulator transcription factor [Breznakiellaceae bacterium SP9]